MDSVTLVRDLMTSEVMSVSPQTPVLDVVKIFTSHKFNGLPVIDPKQHLVGLVTQYNLIKAAAEMIEKGSPTASTLTAADIMEKEPITLQFDDTFETALEVMNKHHRVNPIPVVDSEKKLIGIVSRYDLLRLLKLFGHT